MEPEARVCLIINRFTRNLTVMYASSACERVFHVDPDQLTGKSILLYIRADDLASFVEQVGLIKTSTAISLLRFWFQSPNCPREIPCEAIMFGTADGIVSVVRRCRPFIRRHYLGSREQFESASTRASSFSSCWERPYSSSPASSFSSSPPAPALADSICESKSSSPPRDLPLSALNRIRILELDDERSKPMTHLPEDDPTLLSESTANAQVPGFKEVILQDYFEDHDDGVTDFKRMSISQRRDSHNDIASR